jgi:hypothetical protein
MAAAGPQFYGNPVLAASVADSFGSEEDADCEVVFVQEGAGSDAAPLKVHPAHSYVLRRTVDFFKAKASRVAVHAHTI